MNFQLNTPSFTQMKRSAREAEAMLKLLANARRLMVLCHLSTQESTVSDLAKSVDLSHSALSQHLAKLRDAGLVAAEKRGQAVYYRMCNMEAKALVSVLHLMFCRTAP